MQIGITDNGMDTEDRAIMSASLAGTERQLNNQMEWYNNKQKARHHDRLFKYGWGTRIRTWECRYQKPVPYRLAIPQLLYRLDG